jgi:hypothetical protein
MELDWNPGGTRLQAKANRRGSMELNWNLDGTQWKHETPETLPVNLYITNNTDLKESI